MVKIVDPRDIPDYLFRTYEKITPVRAIQPSGFFYFRRPNGLLEPVLDAFVIKNGITNTFYWVDENEYKATYREVDNVD